jgi:erythromycin esterase
MSEFFGIRAMRFVACAVVGMAVGLGVVQGQTISAGSTDELKRLARPFATVEAVDDSRDLVAWKELVSKARVVSLGESKHGAHEWLALRNRLFYFLVKECGFTAIALETGFPEARRISDYVLGGPGEAEQVVRAGMTWGFGAFAENVELVKWIRKYNENPANARKVRLYGIDLSLGGPMGSVPTAAAIEQTLEYLDRVDKMSALGLRKRLGPHVAKLPHGQLTAAEHDELTIAIGEMVEVVEREAPEYLQRSTKAEYGLARQSAAVARGPGASSVDWVEARRRNPKGRMEDDEREGCGNGGERAVGVGAGEQTFRICA